MPGNDADAPLSEADGPEPYCASIQALASFTSSVPT